jgi:phosphoribosylformylglycinamidine (FGAM) synthase PurS component
MDYRIEMMVKPQWHDARGAAVLEKIRNFFKKEVQDLRTRDVFTVSADITAEQADQIGHELSNPVLQNYLVGESALPEGALVTKSKSQLKNLKLTVSPPFSLVSLTVLNKGTFVLAPDA